MQLVALGAHHLAREPHEEADLLTRAAPILRRERVRRQPLDPTHLNARIDHVHENLLTDAVALRAGHAALLRPPAVAVHDERNVARNEFCRDIGDGVLSHGFIMPAP